MKAWSSPVRLLSLFLIFLSIAATLSWARLDWMIWLVCLRNFAVLTGAGTVTYQILLKTQRIKPTRWEHQLITSLILYLLFDPLLSWFVFLFVGVVTEVAQRFLRVVTGPVFNPAALGVFIVSFFGFLPGWWGTSFSPRIPVPFLDINGISVSTLFVIPIVGYIAHKYKKWPIILSSAAAFSVLYFIFFRSNPAIIVLEGTLTFFLMVMAVEPKTSPVLRNEQIAFGALIGLCIILGIHFAVFDPYIFALLIANAALQLYRYSKKKTMLKKTTVPVVPAQPVTPAA